MYKKDKAILLFILGITLLSCGIKKYPKPPLKPEFSLKRIGEYIYIIPKEPNIEVKSFKYNGKYFYKVSKDEYCFTVKSPNKGKVNRCVERSITRTPKVGITEHRDSVEIRLRGFREYFLYPFNGSPLLEEGKRVVGNKLIIERDFIKKCYALTGVSGGSESNFYKFCINPKPAPTPPTPKNLSLIVRDRVILLVWSLVENLEYIIYRNGKEVARLRTNVFTDKLPDEETIYEVISVNEFGKRSKPAVIFYKP